MQKVSVILPTYNEKEAIGKLCREIHRVLKASRVRHEILVVDDDSPDGTANEVKRLAKRVPEVRVVVRQRDHGLGLSIGEGMRRARGEVVVGMDADGNHDPKDLPRLLEGLEKAELVVASRFQGQGGMKGWRFWPTWIFNAMFRLWGFPIWDNTSGYYAVRKNQLETLGLENIYYGYGDYHLRLLWQAKRAGWKIKEVPTRYRKRLGGVSKSRLLGMATSYTREVWRLRREG